MKRSFGTLALSCALLTLHAAGKAEAADSAATSRRMPFGETTIIDKSDESALAAAIAYHNEHGGTILIMPEVKRGPMPARPNQNTRIVDLRYNGGLHVVRGNHPRLEGNWPQYSGLGTGLGKNVIVSDVLPFDANVETWKGEAIAPNPVNAKQMQDSHEYSNTHNHYQNVLSEVWSFSPTVNAVSLWGDSGSFFPGAKSWRGFLSARSWPVHWQAYVPPGTPSFEDKDFDAQLVGLELDVLNGGLPHGKVSNSVGRNLDKTGVQIVGFGNTNSSAIELRSEDSDDAGKKPDERRGTWHYGIIANNALNSESTLIFSATPLGKTGLDFSITDYSDSAIKIKSRGEKTGISFNGYRGGELYADNDRLVARMGRDGFSLVSASGNEILRVDGSGRLLWTGGRVGLLILPLFMVAVLGVMAWLVYRLTKQVRLARLQLDEYRAMGLANR